MIKKLIAVLLLCICCSLFAEEQKGFEYEVMDSIVFSLKPENSKYTICDIVSILPYNNGYILKLYRTRTALDDKRFYIEIYVTEGFKYYSGSKEYVIKKLEPNKMVVVKVSD